MDLPNEIWVMILENVKDLKTAAKLEMISRNFRQLCLNVIWPKFKRVAVTTRFRLFYELQLDDFEVLRLERNPVEMFLERKAINLVWISVDNWQGTDEILPIFQLKTFPKLRKLEISSQVQTIELSQALGSSFLGGNLTDLNLNLRFHCSDLVHHQYFSVSLRSAIASFAKLEVLRLSLKFWDKSLQLWRTLSNYYLPFVAKVLADKHRLKQLILDDFPKSAMTEDEESELVEAILNSGAQLEALDMRSLHGVIARYHRRLMEEPRPLHPLLPLKKLQLSNILDADDCRSLLDCCPNLEEVKWSNYSSVGTVIVSFLERREGVLRVVTQSEFGAAQVADVQSMVKTRLPTALLESGNTPSDVSTKTFQLQNAIVHWLLRGNT